MPKLGAYCSGAVGYGDLCRFGFQVVGVLGFHAGSSTSGTCPGRAPASGGEGKCGESDLEDGEEPPQFSGDAKAVNRGAAQSSRLSDDFGWI